MSVCPHCGVDHEQAGTVTLQAHWLASRIVAATKLVVAASDPDHQLNAQAVVFGLLLAAVIFADEREWRERVDGPVLPLGEVMADALGVAMHLHGVTGRFVAHVPSSEPERVQ